MQFSNQSCHQCRLHRHCPIYWWCTLTQLYSPSNSQVLCITWNQEAKVLAEAITTGLWFPHFCSDDPKISCHHDDQTAHSLTLPRIPQPEVELTQQKASLAAHLAWWHNPPEDQVKRRSSARDTSAVQVRAGPPCPYPAVAGTLDCTACCKPSLRKTTWNCTWTTQLYTSFWSNYSNSLQFIIENSNTPENI